MVQYVIEFEYREDKPVLTAFQEGGMYKGRDQMVPLDKAVLGVTEKFAVGLREAGVKNSKLKLLITDGDFDYKMRKEASPHDYSSEEEQMVSESRWGSIGRETFDGSN